ncbi:lactonase family protein [Pseudomonas sp. NPDC089422]|uniref:lactonase family protein n=1 Tax=Pseudomonas sp. NPDC089422 TaxID=3364466 RepID=UPI003829E65D
MKKNMITLLLAAALPTATLAGSAPKEPELLYASLGERILAYRVDPDAAELHPLGETLAPANLQFAVKNSTGSMLYVVSSNAGNGTLGAKGDTHVLQAYRIDAASGRLVQVGENVKLPERPINLGLDRGDRFAIVAYNQSATLSVHPIGADGGVGNAVAQGQVPQAGIFTHQVTFTPDDRYVIALARGNDAVKQVPDQPGSINTFSLDAQGLLHKVSSQAIDRGIGPRHLAYHPSQPWVYMAMERGNKLYMYSRDADGRLAERPTYVKDTLKSLDNMEFPRQRGGVIQVSPDGRFLYVSNRADAATERDGKRVNNGGENNIAVFAIDPLTGEPRRIQIVDGHGIEARTMQVDPSGKLLIVANQLTQWVNDHGTLRKEHSNLSVFRIEDSGKLQFVRKYDMDDESKSLLWMDI